MNYKNEETAEYEIEKILKEGELKEKIPKLKENEID